MRIVLAFAAALAAAPVVAAPSPALCVRLNHVTETRVTDDRTVYYKEGSRWYRNDLGTSCPGLQPGVSLQTKTPSPSLCAGDMVTVFRPVTHVEYGTCGLGEFTRVDGPPPR